MTPAFLAVPKRRVWWVVPRQRLRRAGGVGGRVVQVASDQVFSAFSEPVVSLGVRSRNYYVWPVDTGALLRRIRVCHFGQQELSAGERDAGRLGQECEARFLQLGHHELRHVLLRVPCRVPEHHIKRLG